MSAEVNLLPGEYLQTRRTLGRAAVWFAVITVLGGVLAFTAFSTIWRQADTRAAVADLQRHVDAMQTQTAGAAALSEEIETFLAAHAKVEVLESTTDWELLLADIAAAAGGGLRLDNIGVSAPPVDAPGGGQVILSGIARNDQEILRFLRELKASPAIRGVSLEMSSVSADPEGQFYNLFRVQGELAQMGGR